MRNRANEYNSETLIELINSSSAVKKCRVGRVKNDPGRKVLKETFNKCRDYAIESIVSELTPLGKLKGENYIEEIAPDGYNILVRTCKDWEHQLSDTFMSNLIFVRLILLSGDIRQYKPENSVLFGYQSGITAPAVGYMCKYGAENLGLTEVMSDMEDLKQDAKSHNIVPQLTVRVRERYCIDKTAFYRTLEPDAVVAIGKASGRERFVASYYNLPLVVI